MRPSLGTAQRRVFHLLCSPGLVARVGGLLLESRRLFNRCRPAGIACQPPDFKERWEHPPMAGTPKEECSSGRSGVASYRVDGNEHPITSELVEHNPL